MTVPRNAEIKSIHVEEPIYAVGSSIKISHPTFSYCVTIANGARGCLGFAHIKINDKMMCEELFDIDF